jgi:hypothetical protein
MPPATNSLAPEVFLAPSIRLLCLHSACHDMLLIACELLAMNMIYWGVLGCSFCRLTSFHNDVG